MTSYRRALFCYNNFLDENLSYSSQTSGYPATNVVNTVRSRLWKPSGVFEITSSNNTVYASSTSFTIPVGSYDFSSLATAFNVASVGLALTLSRNSAGVCQISAAGSFTLNLSQTSNAIWSTLGFLTSLDVTAATHTANEARYSTGEWLKVDTYLAQSVDFACLIPVNGESFSLLPDGAIYLQGNNVDAWDSPQVNERMEVDYLGAFIAPEDLEPCRYWRIAILDNSNNGIRVAKAYIGTAFIPENTNISTGFSRSSRDLSIRSFSENGTMYVDRRPKALAINSMQMQYMRLTDRSEFEQLMYDLGQENAFFLVLDPSENISERLSNMSYYVSLESDSVFTHVIRDYFNASFNLREVI